jgi:hypothetical protein
MNTTVFSALRKAPAEFVKEMRIEAATQEHCRMVPTTKKVRR